MVVAVIQQLSTSSVLIRSAVQLASSLNKPLGLLLSNGVELGALRVRENLADEVEVFHVAQGEDLIEFCESKEVSFLFIQHSGNRSREVRRLLSLCRGLRIPYCFFKDTYSELDMRKVLLPVSFLEEELEKAQFASAFGRFCHSEIRIMVANDYGSKAKNNVRKMKTLFDKFDFVYTEETGRKDSFKVELEAARIAAGAGVGMVIVSASRDYGLDDIIWGPKEQKVIQASEVPVLLVNPRGDLYALCD